MYAKKHISLDECEIKFGDAGMSFEGYASAFNMVDSYGDTVLPGAYADTLKNRVRPVLMKYNHTGPVIGKYEQLGEDSRGLFCKGELTPGHRVAQDVYASLKHRAVSGLSVGVRIPSGGSQKAGKVRQLKRLELVEISIVDTPADLYATVSDVKSAIEEIESLSDVEALLRDAAGFSRTDAATLISRIKSLSLGDRGQDSNAAEIVALIRAVRVPGA